jgi:hypothetical protein
VSIRRTRVQFQSAPVLSLRGIPIKIIVVQQNSPPQMPIREIPVKLQSPRRRAPCFGYSIVCANVCIDEGEPREGRSVDRVVCDHFLKQWNGIRGAQVESPVITIIVFQAGDAAG